ncbi:protein phosphatase 1 regulatory subunit 42, partial [Acidobacteria bacterium AH-259-D05]|nr:protein phosphatase 1 regulatory subunit 42 [Acidobacteria bacterium AH-259-D05]
GQILAGINNPVQITVPANQQLAQLTSEIFGAGVDPSAVGWFQVSSPVDGLTGFFLFLDNPLSIFDGADLPVSAVKVVFNQIRIGSGYKTEINLINPGDDPADLQLQLIVSDDPAVTQTMMLLEKGVVRLDVATFFEVSEVAPEAYVSVTSDVEVAGFQFIRTPTGDLLGMNGRSTSEQLTNLYFPQVAVLGPWETSLGLVNYSTQPIILTISVFKPDGSLYDNNDLQNNPVTRALNAEESLLENVETMFGFTGGETLEGWIQVESTSAAVNGYISYGIPGTGSVAAVTAVSQGQDRAIFSHIGTAQGFFTGVAVLNPGALATDVRILALQPSGEVLGSFDTVLQPGARISKLINDLIPPANDQNAGLIWVKSQRPVYLSELFGTSNVLANVPPQPAPESYLPDAGLPTLELDPSLAVVQPSGTQSFQITTQGTQVWKVNGIIGGDSEVGTITSQGVYQAPQVVPEPQVVTVSVESEGQTAGASVDVLEKEDLVTQLQLVQAVAYLGTLEKLFTAELTILSTAGNGSRPAAQSPTQEMNSEVFEVAPGVGKILVAPFEGEEITKMIPFEASDGQEFLLLAGKTTGRIIRLNPTTKESKDVATGLDEPTTLVIDSVSGNLLVAEKNQITVVPRTQLESGLVALSRLFEDGPPEQAVRFLPTQGSDGIAVDACTGNVYFWNRTGRVIRQFVRRTREVNTVATDLTPGRLLGFYRRGVACPNAFFLLVAGRGESRVWLVDPRRGTVRQWFLTKGQTDLTFIPSINPLTNSAGVLITEIPEENQGRITLVRTPKLFADKPTSPPKKDTCLGSVIFADPNLEGVVRSALNLAVEEEGERVTCELVKTLQELEASRREIRSLRGLEIFLRLRALLLEGNTIRNITPLARLERLTRLDLTNNAAGDLRPLSGLTALRQLFLSGNGITNLRPLFRLSRLRVLFLSNNSVRDLRPLIPLTNLVSLALRNNDISDIEALLLNEGLGSGDLLDLRDNPLDQEDCEDIQALLDRGVRIAHDLECPSTG